MKEFGRRNDNPQGARIPEQGKSFLPKGPNVGEEETRRPFATIQKASREGSGIKSKRPTDRGGVAKADISITSKRGEVASEGEGTKLGRIYRLKGELEKAYSVDELPPTPVTENAKERLQSWGLSGEMVERLQEITSSYRYDLVPQKLDGMVARGAYINKKTNGEEEIIFPGFFNFENRGAGQCADLSIQLLRDLHNTEYLDDLNSDLSKQGKPRIQPYFLNGFSRTYFTGSNPSHSHVFLGLLPEGAAKEDMVVVDSSFQEISSIDNNGYTIKGMQINPKELHNYHSAAHLSVGTYTEADQQFNVFSPTMIVGSSFDRKIIYQLGVAKNEENGTYHVNVGALLNWLQNFE